MLLRKWRTNSKQLNLLWQQEGVETEYSETSAIDLRPPTKILGLACLGSRKGFNLFRSKGSIEVYNLWILGVDWDSELPSKLRHKWQQWSSKAESSTETKIPRFYLGDIDQEISKFEIHSFLDTTEILALKQNEQLRSSSEIKSLVPYLDENNLLRLTGRLLEADLCFGEKHPVFLPRRCKFTELHVIREHERIGHCGVSATLIQLRKKYWIPKSRQLVKTMIRICLICKRYSATPADQLSGQLPRDRITQSPPFQIVGIDFTGAILVKNNQGTHKSYVSLFTCAVTRAVHLELVSDMSTKCFLLVLRRFLARIGNCKVICSDNARTFKAAERELAYFANILKDSEFQNFVADKGIHWEFIVGHATWWGGFYERLVKTIKDLLRKILGRALLTSEKLSTIISEVEVIVNHRPLTYMENDPG
ncbi:integrase catalytic domain-containing protein [Trichonephila inaurata madagascariensis]|nr:integrase catalytic domain-containing protein [Trichonephila inaurata madagascariensis]